MLSYKVINENLNYEIKSSSCWNESQNTYLSQKKF